MYSVIRFNAPEGSPEGVAFDVLSEVGKRLNEKVSGMFTGFDAVGDRFSCTLSCALVELHEAEVVSKVQCCAPVIQWALANAISVNIDVAVEDDCPAGAAWRELQFSSKTLRLFGELGINLTVTIYDDTAESDPEL